MAALFEKNEGLEEMREIIAHFFATLSGKPTTTRYVSKEGDRRIIVDFTNELDGKIYRVSTSFTRKGEGVYQVVVPLDTNNKEVNDKVVLALIKSIAESKNDEISTATFLEMESIYTPNDGWALIFDRNNARSNLWEVEIVQDDIEKKYFGPFELMTLKV